MAQFSLAQQIEEVEREIAMRREVYPRWVNTGKIRKSEAEYHAARMQSVLKTLKWLQSNESAVKAAIGKLEETDAGPDGMERGREAGGAAQTGAIPSS